MQATRTIQSKARAPGQPTFGRRLLNVPELGAGVGVVIFMTIFTLFDKTMLYGPSVARMVIAAAPQGMAAFGMTFLMMAGEIDLASGATAGLTAGVISAYTCATLGFPEWQGLLLGFLAAVAIGSLNSWTTLKLGMPSFFATMINSFLLAGLSVAIMHGHYYMVGQTMPTVVMLSTPSPVFGLPWTVPIFLGLMVLGDLAIRFTKIGAVVSATGGNKRAAQASGINTNLVKTICFILVSVCAWIGGLFVVSAGQAADAGIGAEWFLWVIAATIIGGCSISGGIGSMAGVTLGLAFIQIMKAGLGAMHMQNNAQGIVIGALLIAAASLDVLRRRTKQY